MNRQLKRNSWVMGEKFFSVGNSFLTKNNFRIMGHLMVGIFLLIQTHYAFGNTPELINFEAEDFFSKEKEFVINDDTFSSKGAYIAVNDGIKNINREKLLVEIPLQEKGSFAVWIRARDLTMSVRSSNGINKTINTPLRGKWCWVSPGIFSDKQIGGLLELYATKIDADSGIDVILLSRDPKFQPSGIYNEFFSLKEKANSSNKIAEIKETIKFLVVPSEKISGKISPYTVTACVDDALRHLDGKKRFSTKKAHALEGNTRWDSMMQTFFRDNMLILLFRPIRKDGSYDRWDFEALDRFVERAITVWGCSELLFLPRWDIPSTRKKQVPTASELDAGEEFFMQLVKRYGQKGKPGVKYWAVADEWPLRNYWKENPDKFVEYYSRLVKKAKAFNPELKLGGPINAFPRTSLIEKLLIECPELDFIAWNMYMSSNANAPLEKVYQRTSLLQSSIVACRQISKKIRKKEIPVIVTAYGSNYRAGNPPDFKLAGPSNGVWEALALNKVVRAGAYAAGTFNVLGLDYGMFGPRDSFGIKGGYVPADIDDETIYVRPSARIMRFFQKYITGQNRCVIDCTSKNGKEIDYLAVNHADKGLAIVIVNKSSESVEVEVKIKNYKLTVYKEFDLPTEYIYCDQDKIIEGKGFIVNKAGVAKLHMAAFSTWLLYVNQ